VISKSSPRNWKKFLLILSNPSQKMLLFCLSFAVFIVVCNGAQNPYNGTCGSTADCLPGLYCVSNKCTTQAGMFGYPCTSNNDCFSAYNCNSNVCNTGTLTGVFGSPCTSNTCYGRDVNGTLTGTTLCVPSTSCNSLYYCMTLGLTGLNYCLQGTSISYPSGQGTSGYPCSVNGDCASGWLCQTNATIYGSYQQPVCLRSSMNDYVYGACKAHADCYNYAIGSPAQPALRCSALQNSSSLCNRGSCDFVRQQCQAWSGTLPIFFTNANCYFGTSVGPQGTSCTGGTCNCGSNV